MKSEKSHQNLKIAQKSLKLEKKTFQNIFAVAERFCQILEYLKINISYHEKRVHIKHLCI